MAAPTTQNYRPDVQGLRAIAILLVVLAHAQIRFFAGGFVGVDVFFVLSGYLISQLLIREYASSGTIALARFYSRRLKRLLPALAVMLILVVLTAPLLLSRHETSAQLSSVVFATTWTSNLFFAFSTLDYFSELQAHDLFLHTWSLGLEEQFYLVWPLLILLALSLATRRLAVHRKILIWLFGLLFAASLGLLWYLTKTQPIWAFYLMPSRIWQFALGALIFVWLSDAQGGNQGAGPQGLPAIWSPWLGALGIGLIIGSAVLLHPGMSYPGAWALIPSVGTGLVIAAGQQQPRAGAGRLLAHPSLVWIGDRSYSWYLWHWPVFMLGLAWGIGSQLAGTVSLILLSLLLAILSYRWVELPFWKGRLSHAAPARVIAVSILVMLIVIAVALNYPRLLSPESDSDAALPATTARSDVPIIYAYGCDAWYANSEVQPCIFGKPDAHKTAVLLGDSVGAQWFSLLPGIFRAPEWRIVVLTKSSCAMVDEDYFYARIGQVYTVCTVWRNKVLDFLSSVRPDILFVGNAATYDFSEAQWTEGSARLLASLTAVAGKVIVVPGTPHLSFDGPSCLEKLTSVPNAPADTEASRCGEALTNTQAADVARYLEQAIQRFPNAQLLDLNDLVCPSGVCSAQTPDGVVVFRDSQHLTDSFVRAQIPIVTKRIELE